MGKLTFDFNCVLTASIALDKYGMGTDRISEITDNRKKNRIPHSHAAASGRSLFETYRDITTRTHYRKLIRISHRLSAAL